MADERAGLFRGKLWFWLPITPLVALDLWTKAAAFRYLAAEYPMQSQHVRRHEVWGGLVRFDLVSWSNPGTVWGIGGQMNGPLVVLRCVAVVVILYFAWRLPRRARLFQWVLGAILAGAIGNLYDNITQPGGAVRDFLLFQATVANQVFTWPAFNVADACITVGAVTLAILLWRGGAQAAGEAEDAGTPSGRGAASETDGRH